MLSAHSSMSSRWESHQKDCIRVGETFPFFRWWKNWLKIDGREKISFYFGEVENDHDLVRCRVCGWRTFSAQTFDARVIGLVDGACQTSNRQNWKKYMMQILRRLISSEIPYLGSNKQGTILFRYYILSSPLHVFPSFCNLKPSRHLQLKVPAVFSHSWLQPPLLSEHSLMSWRNRRSKHYQVYSWLSLSGLVFSFLIFFSIFVCWVLLCFASNWLYLLLLYLFVCINGDHFLCCSARFVVGIFWGKRARCWWSQISKSLLHANSSAMDIKSKSIESYSKT